MEAAVKEQPLNGIPTGEGLTFEKVWAMFQETDRQMKENAERHKELEQSIKETDKIVKENARQMGYLNNRFGEMAEHLVAPGIHERFFELGYNFTAIRPGGYEVRNDEKEVIAEVDILLENGDYIMAVEVKAKPHLKDIKHHVKRLKILRKNRNKHRDTRKIQGAIAGAIFGSKEKQAAIDAGFFVLEQTGDTVKIDIPKGFIPGEW
jgi:uncharacterized coiled-coil protein SlyX